MNEKLIEMAKQCGYWSGQTIEMNDVGITKFAELIIRECLTVVNDTPLGYRDYRNQIEQGMRDACVDRLKNHFGVNS